MAEVLTDNGRVFTGRFSHQPDEVLIDRICRENGINHLLTAPRSPTTTRKIERFHRTLRVEFLAVEGERPADLAALAEARSGDEWVTRHVATNGIITVAYQQISVGKHRVGRTVDVRARTDTLEVWDGNDLIKTVARTKKGTIRKKRAAAR